MSTFTVSVKRITDITAHPNADLLEIVKIDGYSVVVGKQQYKTGDLVAFIPEQSIVPENIIKDLGLEGKLAGPGYNRVKIARIRGVESHGLIYSAREHWSEGMDVKNELGVVKWVMEIPEHLRGDHYFAGPERSISYDIENFLAFSKVFNNDHDVVITEKLHGTFASFGLMPKNLEHKTEGRLIVSSKGLASRHLALKNNNENNVYIKMANALHIKDRISFAFDHIVNSNFASDPVFILGEIIGIQDLKYGCHNKKQFRVFDIWIGKPNLGRFLNDKELDLACSKLGLQRVPVLFRGKFSTETLEKHTNGFETLTGGNEHIREGVVIRTQEEKFCNEIGRKQLKSVSASYKFRKNKDATEFQ